MDAYRWIRADPDTWSARYRDTEFASVVRGEFGYEAFFVPSGRYEYATRLRDAKRWVREEAARRDLYIWWGVHVGAKEA